MSGYEYRIVYSIRRAVIDSEDWAEIGFGSSCAWGGVDAAAFDLETAIQHREWETEGDMPDPETINRGGDES